MTLEELDALYDRANRLILGRSVAAAGKALMFSSSSLDAAADQIADLYDLTVEERSTLATRRGASALEAVQSTTAGLMGGSKGMDAAKAMTIAKKAIDGGHQLKAVRALVTAGPKAAEAAAAGGQLASKATVWGWIATAAYAAGTGSWFAYNLRLHNLAAYEARRLREGIEASQAHASIKDAASAKVSSAVEKAGAGAKVVGDGAGLAMREVRKGGQWVVGTAGDLLRRVHTGGATDVPSSERRS